MSGETASGAPRPARQFSIMHFGSSRGGAPRPKVGENLFVGAGEGELVESWEREPTAIALGARVLEFSAPDFKRDAIASDGVFDDAERFRGAEFETAIRPAKLVSWELPKVCVHNSVRSLADEEFAVTLNHESNEPALGGGGAFAEVGELVL